MSGEERLAAEIDRLRRDSRPFSIANVVTNDGTVVTANIDGVEVPIPVGQLVGAAPRAGDRVLVAWQGADPVLVGGGIGTGGGTGRPVAVIVAAADSPAEAKQGADFVCPGGNDEDTISEALNAAGASLGRTVFREGTYHIDNVFTPPAIVEVQGAPGAEWQIANGVDLTFGIFQCSDLKITHVGAYPPYSSSITMTWGYWTRVFSNDKFPVLKVVVASAGAYDFVPTVFDRCYIVEVECDDSSVALRGTTTGIVVANESRFSMDAASQATQSLTLTGCTRPSIDGYAYSVDIDPTGVVGTTDARITGAFHDVSIGALTRRVTVAGDGAAVTIVSGAADSTIIGRPASITDAGTNTRIIDGTGGGSGSLASLTDVADTLAPSTGQALVYDGAEWDAAAVSVAAADVTDNPTGRAVLTGSTVDANLDTADAAIGGLLGPISLLAGTSAESSDADYTISYPVRLVTMVGLTTDRTVTLPAPGNLAGTALTVTVRCDATCSASNTVTINPDGSDTINGAATLVLDTADAVARLVVDPAGGNWLTV